MEETFFNDHTEIDNDFLNNYLTSDRLNEIL